MHCCPDQHGKTLFDELQYFATLDSEPDERLTCELEIPARYIRVHEVLTDLIQVKEDLTKRITYTEIDSYRRLMNINLEPEDIRALNTSDRAFTNAYRKRKAEVLKGQGN